MIGIAFLQLILITPLSITPGGVANATIVSSHPNNLEIIIKYTNEWVGLLQKHPARPVNHKPVMQHVRRVNNKHSHFFYKPEAVFTHGKGCFMSQFTEDISSDR